MERFEYIWSLATMALTLMLQLWPVTLVLVVGLLVAWTANPPLARNGYQFQRSHLFVFAPIAVALLTLGWGAFIHHQHINFGRSDFASNVLMLLVCLQFLVSVCVVWRMKGYRWLSALIVALAQWFGLACASAIVIFNGH